MQIVYRVDILNLFKILSAPPTAVITAFSNIFVLLISISDAIIYKIQLFIKD